MSDDIIPNITVKPPSITEMAKDDITSRVKDDMLNLAQTLHCGGCHNTLNFAGDMKAYPVKGRKYPDGEQPYGILCEDCQQFENKIEEGPLVAIRFEGPNETPREYAANNLPLEEQGEELAVMPGGTLVRRSTKGKLTKLNKEEAEAAAEEAGLSEDTAFLSLSQPEREAKRGSRRSKEE